MTHPENCPESFPGLSFDSSPPSRVYCCRAPGHPLPHRNADGVTWAPLTPLQRLWRRLRGYPMPSREDAL